MADVPSWAAEKWMVTTLKADAQLMAQVSNVYVDRVPDDAVAPYVYITNLDAQDVSYVNKEIGWSSLLYAVRAVGETTSYSPLVAAAGRIHELLHRARGATDAGPVLASWRERPFRMTETGGDRELRHLGIIVRVLVQESA
mgnify:FL=1